MSRPALSTPLVARSGQLAALRAALGRARDGQAGTVLLAGDAGAGKTRLTEELAAIAAADGASVLIGHCIDLGGVGLPYLPFAEALSRVGSLAAEDPRIAAAVASRPGLGRLSGAAEPASAGEEDVVRLQLFDAVEGLLAELGVLAGPVLLVLEDLHWADQSTRDLLRFLVARARDQRVLVVATYRADDLHRRHPLRPLLAELLRHPTVERVEVPPFTEPELREFVSALAAQRLGDTDVRRVFERSEGNAYFAEELLDVGPGAAGLPESLSDVLLARVERLDGAVQQLVRVASVAGRRVAEPLLRAVSNLDQAEMDDALREAVTRHVLVPAEGGTFAFRHALLAEAVYDDLLPGERVRLHAAYATALVGGGLAGGGLGSAAELAHHSMASHDLPAALSASLAAADEAARRLAPAETLRHLEVVLQLWRAVPDAGQRSDGSLVDLLLRAAHFASRCGELERCVGLAREAVVEAQDAGGVEAEAMARAGLAQHLLAAEMPGAWNESARALMLLTGSAGLVAGRPCDGVGVEASPRLPVGAPTAQLLTAAAVHARTSLNCDRDSDAHEWAAWALDGSRALGLPEIEADVLTTLAVLESGSPDAAAELLQQAHARAVDAGELGAELRSLFNLASNRYYTGEVRAALTYMETGRRRAEETGTRWSTWGLELRVLEVIARYVVGDWDGSTSVAGPVGSTPPDLVAARLSAAACYTAVGRGEDDALDATERLRPAWQRDGQIALVAGGCQVDALTWAGRHGEAVDVAQDVIGYLARTWNDYFLGGIWLSALAVAALADAMAGPTQRAGGSNAGLRAKADGLLEHAVTTAERGRPRYSLGPEGRAWLARAHAEHARASGRADVRAWRAAVAGFGDGYPYEQARSRWRLAEALLEGGDRDAATCEVRLALQTARSLRAAPLTTAVEGLVTRGRLDVGPRGGGIGSRGAVGNVLTRREADVLALVADGLTNRQVGERLFISDKTVSVHLSNVMAKLGASGRTEAVSLAHRRGLLQQLRR